LNNILEKNIEKLKLHKINSNSIEAIKNFSENSTSNYEVVFNKNNLHTITYKGKALVSSYAPDEEAKKFILSSLSNKSYFTAIFFSMSSYHQVDYFLSINKTNKAIIIEKDISIVYKIFSSVYFDSLDRIILILNKDPENVINTLDNIISDKDILNTIPIRHIRSSNINKDYYDNISILYSSLTREKVMSLASLYYFSTIWANNILYNIKLNPAMTIKSFDKVLKNKIPLLLISSGKSIDEKIDKIKELSYTHFVLCLSHGLNTLLENNIIPDAVITTDGGFYSSIHLEKLKTIKNDIYIFTTHTAYPASLSRIKNENIFYFSHNESLESLIYKESVYIPMEGSVIMPALRIAAMLAPSYILLAGCDFAYIDEATHSKYSNAVVIDYITHNKIDTVYNKNIKRRNSSKESIICYDEVSRETSNSLLAYYKHFSLLINNTKNINFYTLTEKSAKIENVEIYNESIDKNINKKNIEIARVKENIYKDDFDKLLQELESSLISNDDKILRNDLVDIIFTWHKKEAIEKNSTENIKKIISEYIRFTKFLNICS